MVPFSYPNYRKLYQRLVKYFITVRGGKIKDHLSPKQIKYKANKSNFQRFHDIQPEAVASKFIIVLLPRSGNTIPLRFHFILSQFEPSKTFELQHPLILPVWFLTGNYAGWKWWQLQGKNQTVEGWAIKILSSFFPILFNCANSPRLAGQVPAVFLARFFWSLYLLSRAERNWSKITQPVLCLRWD